MPRPKKEKVRKKRGRPKKMGRPGVLCNTVILRITRLIREGNWLETAAQAVGVTKQALYKWMRRGNKLLYDRDKKGIPIPLPEQKYARLVTAVHRATCEAEIADLERINAAGLVDWKAIAWKMERRHRRWMKQVEQRHTHEHSGPDGKPIEHAHAHLDVDQLPLDLRVKLLEEIRKQRTPAIEDKSHEPSEGGGRYSGGEGERLPCVQGQDEPLRSGPIDPG